MTTDAAAPAELQRWAAYVHDIDDTHVHLMMADETVDRGDEREIGTFPKALLAHLDPRLGQFLTVRVMTDETISIENTPIPPEHQEASRRDVDELCAMLRRLAEEDDRRQS